MFLDWMDRIPGRLQLACLAAAGCQQSVDGERCKKKVFVLKRRCGLGCILAILPSATRASQRMPVADRWGSSQNQLREPVNAQSATCRQMGTNQCCRTFTTAMSCADPAEDTVTCTHTGQSKRKKKRTSAGVCFDNFDNPAPKAPLPKFPSQQNKMSRTGSSTGTGLTEKKGK